jgi:hypothetical protein
MCTTVPGQKGSINNGINVPSTKGPVITLSFTEKKDNLLQGAQPVCRKPGFASGCLYLRNPSWLWQMAYSLGIGLSPPIPAREKHFVFCRTGFLCSLMRVQDSLGRGLCWDASGNKTTPDWCSVTSSTRCLGLEALHTVLPDISWVSETWRGLFERYGTGSTFFTRCLASLR